MNVIFRVDASTSMGTGHVMRCLALAEALRARGATTRFICRQHAGHLIPFLEERAMPVTRLPAPPASSSTLDSDYGSWLGVTQFQDALETSEALAGENPDWLVVDHYGLDADWESRLRPKVGKLMVIDDLANRSHVCDVLVDQNFSKEGKLRYDGLVPDSCRRVVGTRYALLRREFAMRRAALRVHSAQARKVLVFFGGSDSHDMSRISIEALSAPGLRHLEVDLIVGANNPHRVELEQLAAARPRTRTYSAVSNIAPLMAEADFAIGAAGITTWERMCLGVPSVIISIAENQRPAARALSAAQLIWYAGHFLDVSKEQLIEILKRLADDPRALSALSLQNQLHVDGLGADRIAEVLQPTHVGQLGLRRARAEDVVAYFDWANDPEVRRNAIDSNSIPWSTHQRWFTERLGGSGSHLFVLEAGGLAVGQIRFDERARVLQIDYSLDEIVRGRRWGSLLVSLGMSMIRKSNPKSLIAEVKETNEPSKAVFRRLGFETCQGGSAGVVVYRKELADEASASAGAPSARRTCR